MGTEESRDAGPGGVQAGGDVEGSTIITGDHNTIVIEQRPEREPPKAHPKPARPAQRPGCLHVKVEFALTIAVAFMCMSLGVVNWIKVYLTATPSSTPSSGILTPAPATGMPFTVTPAPAYATALEGWLHDRTGQPLAGMTVRVGGGPQTVTGADGSFVLPGVRPGKQVQLGIDLSADLEKDRVAELLEVAEEGVTIANIVYDPDLRVMAIFSIDRPRNGAGIDLSAGQPYRTEVSGHCYGASRLFGDKPWELWLIAGSEQDQALWLQPVDISGHAWKAGAILSIASEKPEPGKPWTIVAVVAPQGSGLAEIKRFASLKDLPPYAVWSNVVTVETSKP